MVAYRAGAPIRVAQFLADVQRVVVRLGRGSHLLNACADRYHFAVGLAASLVSGKVSLLPSTHTPEMMRQLTAFAPDVVCLTDEASCSIALPQLAYPADAGPAANAAAAEDANPTVPRIDPGQLAAYVFTSGSTGTPVPYRKSWGRLFDCVRVEAERLGLSGPARWAILATVPPQHMYGFESSVLMALADGHALCAERPFYPADIATALEALPDRKSVV